MSKSHTLQSAHYKSESFTVNSTDIKNGVPKGFTRRRILFLFLNNKLFYVIYRFLNLD